MEKLYQDKNLLQDLYTNQEKTGREIGKILNCSRYIIYYHLHKYNILVRKSNLRKLNLDKNMLQDLYKKQKKPK